MADYDKFSPSKRPEMVLACLVKHLGGFVTIPMEAFRDIDDNCLILMHKATDGTVNVSVVEGGEAQRIRSEQLVPNVGDPHGQA